MREKFSIPVDKITVEDDSGRTVFAELSTLEGIYFVIKDSHDDNGKFKKIAWFYIALTEVVIGDATIALT